MSIPIRTVASPVFAACVLSAAAATACYANSLEITGSDRTVYLTVDEIAAIGATELHTTTIWTDGIQHFVGVRGSDLVEALGIDAHQVIAHALNDYDVVIPFEVFGADTTLIAYERNGEPMSVRDRGPLWIVFPYDADPHYRSDAYQAYSIWNLTSVTFE